MRKLLVFMALLFPLAALAEIQPPREYGKATTITFELFSADGTNDTEETDSGTDLEVACDDTDDDSQFDGTASGTDFTDENGLYTVPLTAAEMSCAYVTLRIIPSGDAVTQYVRIPTFGHPLAAIPSYEPYRLAVAADATTSSVTQTDLTASASSTADDYKHHVLRVFDDSTGEHYEATISSYDESTQVATHTAIPAAVVSGDGLIVLSRKQVPVQVDGSGNLHSVVKAMDDETITSGVVAANAIGASELATDAIGDDQLNTDGGEFTEAGGTGDHLTAVPYNSTWDAEIESEATDALNAYDPPTDTEMDNGFAGLNDLSAAQVNAEADTALSDYDPPTRAELTSDISGLNDLSAAQVNAEVDTALSDYDPPTRAELTSDIAGLNDPTAAAIVTALLSESCAAPGAGTVEEQLCTDLDAILDDTNELQSDDIPGDIAALNDLSAAQVNAEVDTALSDYDSPTRAELTSDIAGLNDLDAAGVRTAVGLASANLDTQLATIDGNVDDLEAGLEMHMLVDSAFLNCTVDTANFAGSTTSFACDLTDRDDVLVTQATGDLTGLEIVVTSGAQIREQRFINGNDGSGNSTVWDGANNELRIYLARALPATLADGVSVIIR